MSFDMELRIPCEDSEYNLFCLVFIFFLRILQRDIFKFLMV